MLIVNRTAPNSFICRGAVIHPGINVIPEKQEKAVLACEEFKGQVDSGRITIVRLPEAPKDEKPGKSIKMTGHRVNDSANSILSLTETQASEVAKGIQEVALLERLFEVETRPGVLSAAREAQNKINMELGVVSN